jgi:hypothetical protein
MHDNKSKIDLIKPIAHIYSFLNLVSKADPTPYLPAPLPYVGLPHLPSNPRLCYTSPFGIGSEPLLTHPPFPSLNGDGRRRIGV